jgi:tRNA pseudouridine55 synthase
VAAVGDGLLVVDKPTGWTSHDVVGKVRRLSGTRRVGHAGTLDPMATGVLVLGVNRGTKLLTHLVGCDKAYAATLRLGVSTLTDDAEGEVTAVADASRVDPERLAEAVAALTGRIEQVPSAVSAVKVGGVRSYARVRAGEDVRLAARPVTVHRFDVLDVRSDPSHGCTDLDIEVEVGSGTYVRALARDLGEALGVGGHLTALRRTRVGRFGLDGAHTLEEVAADVEEAVVPLADAAASVFPVRRLGEGEATALGHGQRIDSEQPGRPEPVAAVGPDGVLVALLDETGPRARSHVVFAPRHGG